MLFARVNAQQKDVLDAEMNGATEARWYRRLKIIDLSGQGHSVSDWCVSTWKRTISSR